MNAPENKVIPVKVALRIRPLVPREKDDACTECLRTANGEPQVILGKDKSFTYDYVFSQQTPQVEVYETAVQSLLKALFKGYNTTVIAYGQTGSGKTYTMGSGYLTLCAANASLITSESSNILNCGNFDEVGIIPRVMNDLFRTIDEEQRLNKDAKYTVKVSFVEVYNEEIKDLFNIKSSTGANTEPLNIREENNTIRVVNLSEISVTNALSTIQLLERGSSMRVVGGTAMNDQSSRSHAIFTITLEQHLSENNIIKSKFHLVDLAGSERQSKTKAEGLRLKEGININLGLLALGNVISILGEDNTSNKSKHVPYRESKLTRLLQDSLGGNSHTLMVACVSPADSNMEETLNTLRYADRARKIKNKPIVNVDPQAVELAKLRQQVQELKAQIYQLTGGANYTPNLCVDNSNEINLLKEENEKLKTENIKLIGDFQRLVYTNRVNYERMNQLEAEKEEQRAKFEEIKATLEKIKKENDEQQLTMNQSLDATTMSTMPNNSKILINELQSKIGEYEQLSDKKNATMAQNEDDLNCDGLNEPLVKDYALRQAKMQVQLTEYDSLLLKKEMLILNMMETISQTNKDTKIDTNLDELKSRIETLEKEKEDLLDQIRNNDKKISEQKRDKLKQLESEVLDLKRKEREFHRMNKLKEENEKNCEKLRNEIQHIKMERVKLIKQMKADTETFRKYKQEKEKEVNQLKALERKRMVEINKLQEGNHRQEAVLRRKNEEITRIQKQLRETLEKQKLVAEKRQQTFEKKESSTLGEKLRTWITQELELSVSLAEARINLNKLIEERKESAAELAKLTEKLNEFNQEDEESQTNNNNNASSLPPPSKRKYLGADMDSTYCTSNSTSVGLTLGDEDDTQLTKAQLEQRIERIKEDIECKNVQINEIQQMVIEGDQDDKSKHLFHNIHGLLEAKVLLKHLYNSGVQYLLDLKLKQTQYETNSTSLTHELKEIKKKYETIEEEYNKSQKAFNNEKSHLIQHYEQRILLLLKSKITSEDCKSDERFNLILEQIQKMEQKIDKEMLNDDSFQVPRSKSGIHDLTNREDYRRSQKLKRDHRRTRIIRTLPMFADPNSLSVTDRHIESISEHSPPPMSPHDDIIEATPDDKLKDPDWSKTPMHVKPKSRKIVPRKVGLRRNSKSKSNVKMEQIEGSDSLTPATNDENKLSI